MVFPEQITKIMAHADGANSAELAIVHKCEHPSEAIDITGENCDAIEEKIPEVRFGFTYVRHGRLSAENFDGFVDVLAG